MEERTEEHIRIKIAVTLHKLLEANKNIKPIKGNDSIPRSYNQIALNAELRKATVSNVFNAQSSPNSVTLFSIIDAMGHSLKEFAEIYDNISIEEINIFAKSHE